MGERKGQSSWLTAIQMKSSTGINATQHIAKGNKQQINIHTKAEASPFFTYGKNFPEFVLKQTERRRRRWR
jgi:hypothetical protein